MEQYRYISLDYLETMTDGDPAMQKEMLGMLVSEFDLEIPRLRAQMKDKDAAALASTSHRFKSTLAYVGNETLSDANARLEQLARAGKVDREAETALVTLEKFAEAVKEELQMAYDSL